MSAYAPLNRSTERRKREATMRIAERHYTADEYLELMSDMDEDRVDVRIYDDCMILMRTFSAGPSGHQAITSFSRRR